jgi:hypothetical protein
VVKEWQFIKSSILSNYKLNKEEKDLYEKSKIIRSN